MPKIMKTLNNISRCQAIYRKELIKVDGLSACHFAFVLLISRKEGLSQEEIAKEICLNKSTVTRTLSYLEEKGYIVRKANSNDKRQILVFPTQKMAEIAPVVRNVSKDWNSLLTQEISEEELQIFYSVLNKMENRARAIIENCNGGTK